MIFIAASSIGNPAILRQKGVLKLLKVIIFCILFFISLQNVTLAQTFIYYSSSNSSSTSRGVRIIPNTSTIKFVNSSGIFDGSTDYIEVDVIVENMNNKTKIDSRLLLDINSPYYRVKDFTVHERRLNLKYRKIENQNITIKESEPWMFIENNSIMERTYNEVITYAKQNWQTVYDNGSHQGNSISINSDSSSVSTATDNTPIEVKPKELPNLSWDGTWKTTNGEMIIKQNKDKFICILSGQKLPADLINNKLIGKWSDVKFFNSVERCGDFQFIMSPNGRFITIKWKDAGTDWVTDSTADRM